MICTITTDAGFCNIEKIGTYAFEIKIGTIKINKSGVFKNNPSDNNSAEMMSIVNALTCFLLRRVKYSKIILNTDSLISIRLLSKKRINEKWSNQEHKKIRQAYDKLNVKNIEFRHVKAHSNNETSRQYVNSQCDKICKELLNKTRKWQKNQKLDGQMEHGILQEGVQK